MCYLTEEQEIEILRNADKVIRDALDMLKKVKFSPIHESFANDLLSIDDMLHDACICVLETEREKTEREHDEFLEERHILEERSAYLSQVL